MIKCDMRSVEEEENKKKSIGEKWIKEKKEKKRKDSIRWEEITINDIEEKD